MGYQSTVILFDKIDEYPDINADVDKIVDFVKGILLDTDLLYTRGLSIVFSIWSDAKRALNKAGFRFDKFEDINIEWNDNELEQLIDKRLQFFTIEKDRPVTMKALLPNDNDRKLAIELANKSPRSLIKLLGTFYNMEHDTSGVNSFRPQTIAIGMTKYCKNFDYYSNQYVKTGGKNDLYSWINKILLLRRISFTSDDVKKEFSLTVKNSQTYIQNMTKLQLIKEALRPDENGQTIYEVIDPRLKYLISRGILELGE